MNGNDRSRTLALGLIADVRRDVAAGRISHATATLAQLERQVAASICDHCAYFAQTRAGVTVPRGWAG